MCGAETCRGFIGKKRAPPPPKAPVRKKGTTVVSKVKRVAQGRVRKRSKDHVEITYENGKIRDTIYRPYPRLATNPGKGTKIYGIKAQTKAKKVSSRVKKVDTKVKKVVKVPATKKTTTLGKRKRRSPTEKKGKSNSKSPKKKDTIISGRKIAKPRSKKLAVASVKSTNPAQPIYDTVSHRSRNRNVR
jgi:hypothetical protein